jgi:hypothetical protein
MATRNYRIEWEDGTVRYRKLNEQDATAWQKRAEDKQTTIKSVQPGDPEPDGAPATPAARRSQEAK